MKKINRMKLSIIVVLLLCSLYLCQCSTKPSAQVEPPDSQGPASAVTSPAEDNPGEEVDIPVPGEENGTTETPDSLQEQAMEAYKDALSAWEKEDTDAALEALDEAYGLMLKIETNPDSPVFEDKNNLRLMIAQRIQEIYAVHSDRVINNHKSIPLTENQYVLAEIKSFQTREREYFLAAYKNSGLYREMILRELRQAGLPDELSWIPIIESGFKVRAYSRARALGLWQFISSTGYRFGLKKDRWVDERMDPLKATRAAVKYLGELHDLFGDWTTALASYNCGEFQVQRVIRAQRVNYLDNFWDLFIMLPGETARFVPRILAVLLIVRDPAKYGFELPEPEQPQLYELVSMNQPVRLSALSEKMGFAADTLALLNPELRSDATPDRDYQLKVPVGTGRQVLETLASLSRWLPPEASYTIHRVRRGETVSVIARHYRTSVSAITRLNNLRRSYMIRPGQSLKIPTRGGKTYPDIGYQDSTATSTSHPVSAPITKKPQGAGEYIVQAGDSPFSIAEKNGMQLDEFMSINGLKRWSRIYPGQKLWIIAKE